MDWCQDHRSDDAPNRRTGRSVAVYVRCGNLLPREELQATIRSIVGGLVLPLKSKGLEVVLTGDVADENCAYDAQRTFRQFLPLGTIAEFHANRQPMERTMARCFVMTPVTGLYPQSSFFERLLLVLRKFLL